MSWAFLTPFLTFRLLHENPLRRVSLLKWFCLKVFFKCAFQSDWWISSLRSHLEVKYQWYLFLNPFKLGLMVLLLIANPRPNRELWHSKAVTMNIFEAKAHKALLISIELTAPQQDIQLDAPTRQLPIFSYSCKLYLLILKGNFRNHTFRCQKYSTCSANAQS